jgi:hypothetical protein
MSLVPVVERLGRPAAGVDVALAAWHVAHFRVGAEVDRAAAAAPCIAGGDDGSQL